MAVAAKLGNSGAASRLARKAAWFFSTILVLG
jgi:hypothetical protein